MEDKQGEKAVQALEASLALDTNDAWTHYWLATALLSRRTTAATDQAIVHYRRALELKPDLHRARSCLGILLVGRRRYEEAIGNYERLFAADGITFTIPAGTSIAARGYLVVASNATFLESEYGATNVVGDFTGDLADGGERIEFKGRSQLQLHPAAEDKQ